MGGGGRGRRGWVGERDIDRHTLKQSELRAGTDFEITARENREWGEGGGGGGGREGWAERERERER